MLFRDRLSAAFKQLPKDKQNKRQMSKDVGASTGTVQDWFNGKTKMPRAEHLPNLARYLGVSEVWLRDGKGPMKASESNILAAKIGDQQVPILSYVQAGHPNEVILSSDQEYVLSDLEFKGDAFALEIKGESMLPDFREGDRIIVDCGLAPQPGDFVVAKNGEEEATFKRYKLISTVPVDIFTLEPLNDVFPTLRSDKEPLEIVGVMVEHRRYRKRS